MSVSLSELHVWGFSQLSHGRNSEWSQHLFQDSWGCWTCQNGLSNGWSRNYWKAKADKQKWAPTVLDSRHVSTFIFGTLHLQYLVHTGSSARNWTPEKSSLPLRLNMIEWEFQKWGIPKSPWFSILSTGRSWLAWFGVSLWLRKPSLYSNSICIEI